MKKLSSLVIVLALIIMAALSVSVSYAENGSSGRNNFPDGFSHWTSKYPDDVSYSPGQGERTHPLQIFRDQSGKLARSIDNQLYSGNWSGYVLTNYETRKNYTSATGAWTVPTVTVPSGQTSGYSSSWVGIGGFCTNSTCTRGDRTLIQLGTEADKSGTSPAQYYAWYEMLPQAETFISGLVVHPGDNITASLVLTGTSRGQQTWKLILNNTTTGVAWTKNVNYQSSLLSSEWVQEAPSSNSGILPLANFSTTKFDPESVNNGASPAFTAVNQVIMLNPHGQTSNPSLPDSDKDGFDACFGNGTAFTTCAIPAS